MTNDSGARELVPGLDPTAFVRAPRYVDKGTNLTIGARTSVNMGLTAPDVASTSIGAGPSHLRIAARADVPLGSMARSREEFARLFDADATASVRAAV